MKVLFIGDTVARAGREFVRDRLDGLKKEFDIDFTVLNCENAAGGFGITPKVADELLGWGIDVLTSGNHIWDKREILGYLDSQPRILRPANYPPPNPGHGRVMVETAGGIPVAVINIQGRTYMPPIDDPFRAVDAEIEALPDAVKVILIDVHAEATAEKVALGWYLDGRASLVVGTHTHIPTADERILPRGLAYQTDVGMTGPFDSVIGMTKGPVFERFHRQVPVKFEAASEKVELNAIVVEIDETTGKSIRIERVHRTA
jgi:metallophosphoesterase (TIGR00282 family)